MPIRTGGYKMPSAPITCRQLHSTEGHRWVSRRLRPTVLPSLASSVLMWERRVSVETQSQVTVLPTSPRIISAANTVRYASVPASYSSPYGVWSMSESHRFCGMSLTNSAS